MEPSTLTKDQEKRLVRILRFLTHAVEPELALPIAALGYDVDEHRLGWELFALAAGTQRPFPFTVEVARMASEELSFDELMAELTEFEGRWFTQARLALERFVPDAHRESALAAFFMGLSNEPSKRVESTANFVTRLIDLRTSALPGAQDAYTSLEKKGLNGAAVAQMQKVIKRVEQLGQPLPTRVSHDALTESVERQISAFEQLDAWYKDWANILHRELAYQDALALGIR